MAIARWPEPRSSRRIITLCFAYSGHRAPCFLVGADRIVLPAFSSDAAGCDVISAAMPKEWLAGSLRCLGQHG